MTKKEEEVEILIIHDSILSASTQNLIKREFPWIDMFDHEGPTVINVMRDLIVIVFEHLVIMSKKDLDLRIKYTERILRNSTLKKFRQVLLTCKDAARGLVGNQWTLRAAKNMTMEQF